MQTRFPCHVEFNDGKQPEAFDTDNALAIMYRACDILDRVNITFELAPGEKVKIICDFNEGTANPQELNAKSGVQNFYFFQTEPLENAMKVMAKIRLFEWLATLGDTRINTIIQKNLTSVSDQAVNNTYKELLRQPWLKFGAINTVSNVHAIVRQVLATKGPEGKEIHGYNAVIHIKNQITMRLLGPKGPEQQARPAHGSR